MLRQWRFQFTCYATVNCIFLSIKGKISEIRLEFYAQMILQLRTIIVSVFMNNRSGHILLIVIALDTYGMMTYIQIKRSVIVFIHMQVLGKILNLRVVS